MTKKLINDLRSLLVSGGFDICQWASNKLDIKLEPS